MSKSFLGYSPSLHYGFIGVGRRSLKSSLIARVQKMDSRTEAKAGLTAPDNSPAGVLTVGPPLLKSHIEFLKYKLSPVIL